MSLDKKHPSEDDTIEPKTSLQAGRAASTGEGIDQTKGNSSVGDDPAAQFLASVGPFPPMTPEQEKKLVRKIDRWMIPLVGSQPRDSLFVPAKST